MKVVVNINGKEEEIPPVEEMPALNIAKVEVKPKGSGSVTIKIPQDDKSQQIMKDFLVKVCEELDYTTVKIASCDCYGDPSFVLERRHFDYYSCRRHYGNYFVLAFRSRSFKAAIARMKKMFSKEDIVWHYTTEAEVDAEHDRLFEEWRNKRDGK